MKNTDFCAYCCDQRKVETDTHKKVVLSDVYGFMRECGVTKGGVKMFGDHEIYQNSDDPAKVEAYKWLLSVFDGPSAPVVPDGQMQLF